MLLSRTAGQGLEPVGDVSHAMFHGPCLHAKGHSFGCLAVESLASVDTFFKLLESCRIEILAHLRAVKDQLPVVVGGLAGCLYGHCLLLEGLLNEVETIDTHNLTFF